MDKVANLPANQRNELFMETAAKKGIAPAIVEKDFWVCWTLKHLFLIDAIKSHIVFKGGTTLSKIFSKIERFSEDIDLILDWGLLGYGKDQKNPYLKHSSKRQQDIFNKSVNQQAVFYIENTLCSILQELTKICPNLKVELNPDNPECINILYPAAFGDDYIRPQVVLEIGPLAAWVPSGHYTITPYAAEEFPEIFTEPKCKVVAIKAE